LKEKSRKNYLSEEVYIGQGLGFSFKLNEGIEEESSSAVRF